MKTKLFRTGRTYHSENEPRKINFSVLRKKDNVILLERSDNVYEILELKYVQKEINEDESGVELQDSKITKLCEALEIFNKYTK